MPHSNCRPDVPIRHNGVDAAWLRGPHAVTDEELRCNLEAIFLSAAYLLWYCQNTGCGNLDFREAAENFLDRAKTEDVSPVRFFDPA